jgi:tetratricopeptide (TPR) repeat protein
MNDLRDRYSHLIDQLVQQLRPGDRLVSAQVYADLVDELEPDSHQLFSDCLDDAVLRAEQRVGDPELQYQAQQTLANLKIIEIAWQQYQREVGIRDLLTRTIFQITSADEGDRLLPLVNAIDPTALYCLHDSQLQQLASSLRSALQLGQMAGDRTCALSDLIQGIHRGLRAWENVRPSVQQWLNHSPEGQSGGGTRPWQAWANQGVGPLCQRMFMALHTDKLLEDWAATDDSVTLPELVELLILLQRIQQALLAWTRQQPYEESAAARLINTMYIGFASTWMQLFNGFTRSTCLNGRHREEFALACRQMGLQVLREFTTQPYFPLYSNQFALAQGQNFITTIHYLVAPMQRGESTPEQGRLITLGGMFLRMAGRFPEATALHEKALEVAQAQADRHCTIANLNHLSRLAAIQSQYSLAIEQSQRALILARQTGDSWGEVNALTNLGYAAAQQAHLRQAKVAGYEAPMGHLMEAIDKAQDLQDQASEAYCAVNLAQVCLDLNHPIESLRWIQTGLKAAAQCGDIYLQALSFTVMAEACQALQHPNDAIYAACLALHHFHQLNCREWRQPAALLSNLQTRLGDRFEDLLQAELPQILDQIGVEGFAHIPTLLAQYQNLEPID